MDWINQVRGILGKYVDRQPQVPPGVQPGVEHEADFSAVQRDFDELLKRVPRESLVTALATAFRSEETPPFGKMVAHMFSQSKDEQKAGVLNHLLAINPSSASDELLRFLSSRNITPEEAHAVQPGTVERIANEAARKDAGIVEHIASYYLDHPNLLKTLGAGPLASAIRHLGDQMVERRPRALGLS
jgi:hypothetical protein